MKTMRYLIIILLAAILCSWSGNNIHASETHTYKHFTVGSLMGFPTIGMSTRKISGHHGINFSINYTTPFLPTIISIPKASLHYIYYFQKDNRHRWYVGIGPSASFVHINLSGMEIYTEEYEPLNMYDPEILEGVDPEQRMSAVDAINRDRKKRKPNKGPFYSQHRFYFHPVDIIIGKEFFKENGTSNFIEMQLSLFKYEDMYKKWTRVWVSLSFGKGF